MVDPDKNNQDNAPVEDSDDTKTRKTVRLRPSVTPAGINLTPLPKAPLTDPLSGRDTDTGNLEVMEDTQTRRTVKLKPIATQTAGPSIKPAIPIVGRPAGDGANTQTRKTIVLKPTAVSPASVKVNGPADAAPSDSEDTKTRKTVRLRSSAVTPAGVKIAGEDSESDLDSSDTIKIARPARPGMIPPKVPAPAAPAADPSKATMVLPGHGAEQQSKDGVPVVLLHTMPPSRPLPEGTVGPDVPGLKGAGHKPAVGDHLLKSAGSTNAAAAGTSAAAAGKEAKPAAEKEIQVAAVKEVKPAAEAEAKPAVEPKFKPAPAAGAPSRLYLTLAAVSLVLIAVTVTLTAVQYLNLCQQQNIELPFLSQSK